jgi:tetratricopeptide (TPR) repeat protein
VNHAAFQIFKAHLTGDEARGQAYEHHQAKRLDEADRLYCIALELEPADPLTLNNHATVLQELGRLDEALECYRQAIELDAEFPIAHYNMAAVLQDLGRPEEAVACYRRVIEWQPDVPDVWFRLGSVHQTLGRFAEAQDSYERVLKLQPDHAPALGNLGAVLREQGELDGALAALRRAVALQPDSPEALNNLGSVLEGRGEEAEALDCYRQALALRPGFALAANNLGALLQSQGRFEDSRQWVSRALESRPDYPEAIYNLGNVLQAEGRFDDALDLYDRALRARPGFSEALWARAVTLLAKGDYARGWREYELRYSAHVTGKADQKPGFPFPMWRGEPIAGKRLLLVAEQGFGDQIQFVRYASLFAQQGAQVDVMAAKPVARLFQSVPGVRRVVAEVPGDPALYDYWCLMASAPLCAGTVAETVPARVPYLHAPDDAVRKWGERLRALPQGHLKVGLIWAGNPGYKSDRFRSMTFQSLMPLAGVANVSYVSVQTGARAAEALTRAGFPALHLGGEMGDFADTAGLFMNLDLLMAVDTAFAHLAGALGRKVWLLQAAIPDWRWPHDRQDSIWYPTVRLMRQDTAGDWGPVVARAARDLEKLALLRT